MTNVRNPNRYIGMELPKKNFLRLLPRIKEMLSVTPMAKKL